MKVKLLQRATANKLLLMIKEKTFSAHHGKQTSKDYISKQKQFEGKKKYNSIKFCCKALSITNSRFGKRFQTESPRESVNIIIIIIILFKYHQYYMSVVYIRYLQVQYIIMPFSLLYIQKIRQILMIRQSKQKPQGL